MPKIRFDSPERSADEDASYEDIPEKSPKWFDIFKDEPITFEETGDHTVTSHKIEAQKAFEDEEKAYQTKLSKAPRSSEEGWLRTVMQKGTSGDKVAALILSVQKAPVNNFNALSSLISMVKVSKKKQCMSVLDNLCELLTDELLPPGKKLRTWPQHPFKYLSTISNGRERTKLLASWLYEAKLKEAYMELILSLEAIAKDTVDTYREKAVSAMYKLLSAHPEQEELLLRNIVNKLGDPVQKVVSKVIYCLTQLLRIHPNMKLVVMNEVEKLLFRPNIGVRTQYYAICFLSQFVFSNEDQEVARYLIKIYFSFFKASIKKGDVDSRLMGALLMGVKRAYPFAKLDAKSLEEHISTLYKLVHISPFNISLHTLCLLEQVSLQSEDRFYSALYKKLLDPKLVNTSHQAMFINLMYKSLSKDENIPRVIAIIKRLFQVCLQMPVCYLCGVLYMVSQVLKNKNLLLLQSKAVQISKFDEDTSEDEVYYDADKEKEENPETEAKEKKVTGWHFVEYSTKSKKNKSFAYDWKARNPAYSNADTTAYFELLDLSNHFHPTVSLFATKILNGEVIVYTGDPLADFSLIRFLERFSFKNPKSNLNSESSEFKGPDPKLAQRKYYVPSGAKSVNVNSKLYLNQEARFVPVDELFLYRYLKEKDVGVESKKSKAEDDFDDNDSVASEEFEEMLDSMMGKKAAPRDYLADVGDKLKKGSLPGKGDPAAEDSESEVSESEEEEVDETGSVDLSEDEMPSEAEEGTDDEEEMEFSEGSGGEEDIDIDIDEIMNDTGKKSKSKMKTIGLKKRSKNSLEGLFAPAEEFSELLEETGSAKSKSGMFNTLANPENAAEKQLNWEVKRDRWVRGANERKRKFNRPGGKFRKKFKK